MSQIIFMLLPYKIYIFVQSCTSVPPKQHEDRTIPQEG